jgi:hypothetical protein
LVGVPFLAGAGDIGPAAIFFRLALRSIEIETLEDTPHRPFTGVTFLAGRGI